MEYLIGLVLSLVVAGIAGFDRDRAFYPTVLVVCCDGSLMKGNWDWNIIPEDKAEWVIFSVALLIVLGAALWIFR
jgi:hypothetical protein